MKRLLSLLLLGGCATTPVATPQLERCSLVDETACVAYGATIPEATRPSAQLVVGLMDRAATLPAEDAVDYWRRVEEIMATSDQANPVVNRRAAIAYAALARLAAERIHDDATTIEQALNDSQDAVERVRELAAFAVEWGDPRTQARAAHAIADAYGRQAANLASFALPMELTVSGKASLGQKRDAIVGELLAEQRLVLSGVAEHCRRHRIEDPACSDRPEPERVSRPDDPRRRTTCGLRVGMPEAEVTRRVGKLEPLRSTPEDGCQNMGRGSLVVELCFGVVRSVDNATDECPR